MKKANSRFFFTLVYQDFVPAPNGGDKVAISQ